MNDLTSAALDYHRYPTPGKIALQITKSTHSQEDLILAYTPGVGEPVKAIAQDPSQVFNYTAKSNLIAVVTDGSAVLGFGDIGPLASKPVMEGKAVLFKKFGNVNAFDLELNTRNPDHFIDVVTSLAPTFGGINLEDIRSPECFYIEQAIQKQVDIPVFHDDQHGTAITVAAGLLNALDIQGKHLAHIRIVCLGAGAAGIASMKLLVLLGIAPEQITLVDRSGVIHDQRQDLTDYKKHFAHKTSHRTLKDALEGADVIIGLAGPDLLSPECLQSMAKNPIIFVLSNPDPEIDPHLAQQVRPDSIIATGRSDYPNQVNNVLCFPYIFRGALDARATCITPAMHIAAVHAIKQIARDSNIPQEVQQAYRDTAHFHFGPDYILPKPTDPRLLHKVSKAVEQAAKV